MWQEPGPLMFFLVSNTLQVTFQGDTTGLLPARDQKEGARSFLLEPVTQVFLICCPAASQVGGQHWVTLTRQGQVSSSVPTFPSQTSTSSSKHITDGFPHTRLISVVDDPLCCLHKLSILQYSTWPLLWKPTPPQTRYNSSQMWVGRLTPSS